MNVTLSKLQVLFNKAILPLSAVSDHWHHTLKSFHRPLPVTRAYTRKKCSNQHSSALQGFFLWLKVLYLQQEVDSCTSSPAASHLLTLLLNGSLSRRHPLLPYCQYLHVLSHVHCPVAGPRGGKGATSPGIHIERGHPHR
jgi:hypothetical protein